MRLAVLYYLAQTQNADRHRQAHRDKQSRSEKSGSGLRRKYSRMVHPGPWVCSESYWEKDLSEAEWKAIFAEAFGPDAVSDWDA